MPDPASSEQTEARFQALETTIVYQEQMVDELNGVVIRQQDQIDLLNEKVRKLEELLKEQSEPVEAEGDEPPPPHY